MKRHEGEPAEPSFTAVTVEQGHARYSGYEFFLMMGSGCLPDLPGWYEPRKVITLASLLVVPRPSVMLWTDKRLAKALGVEVSAVRLQFIACSPMYLASRELRRPTTDGLSVRYMVPRAAEE